MVVPPLRRTQDELDAADSAAERSGVGETDDCSSASDSGDLAPSTPGTVRASRIARKSLQTHHAQVDHKSDSDMDTDSPAMTYSDMWHAHMSALPPISRLPPELLATVFDYLGSKSDQLSFVLVSHLWFSVAIESIWFRPHITNFATLTLFQRTLLPPSPRPTPPVDIGSPDFNLQPPAEFSSEHKENFDSMIFENSRPEAVDIKSLAPFAPYHSYVRRLNLTSVSNFVTDELLTCTKVCDRLERLTLSNCQLLTDAAILPIIANNSRIQSVDVSNLEFITDETLLRLASNCRHLQGLYASGCKKLTDKGVVALAESCNMLKRIKLNDCLHITDESVRALVANCPALVELDLANCRGISSLALRDVMVQLPVLREFRVALNSNIDDTCFRSLPPDTVFEKLRVVDLTACSVLTDSAIGRLVHCAPRLRNVVVAKCTNITDRGVQYLSLLENNLRYLHLGHCSNITNRSVNVLVRRCPKMEYIDVACCTQLTDEAVRDLSTLCKLRRIGLVKCTSVTDAGIYALARRQAVENTLERIHLSYCSNISLSAVTQLVNACGRLTHLSLTGVRPFMRPDLTRFCRPAPPEFTQFQQTQFCVFSGSGVVRMRQQLNALLTEQRRVEQVSLANSDIGSVALDAGPDALAANLAANMGRLPPTPFGPEHEGLPPRGPVTLLPRTTLSTLAAVAQTVPDFVTGMDDDYTEEDLG